MKEFEIRNQVRLPMRKCVELVLSGIQFRLFRAAITVAIVTLAVAFLTTILGDSLIGRSVGDSIPQLTKPRRVLVFWVQRLSRLISEPDLMATIMTARPGDSRWQEFKNWSACDDAALSGLKEVAADEDRYLRFFSDLKEGQLRRLAGRIRGREIFQLLQDHLAMDTFTAELPGIGKQMPTSVDAFKTFLQKWISTRPLRQSIIDGQKRAMTEARASVFKGQSAQEFLAELEKPKMDALNRLGFCMVPDEIPVLKDRAQERLKARKMDRLLRNTVFKQKFSNRFGIKDLNKVTSDELYDTMRSRGNAEWLVTTTREIGEPFDLAVDGIRQTSAARVQEKRLADVEAAVDALNSQRGFLGFPPRVMWLIAVSLIVCIVGITNAMLMSVTERFKEIATMKCLGATDGFIMVNFILESGFQGLAGGTIGSVLGAILGILRSSLTYGSLAIQNVPFLEMLVVLLVSIAAGIILSVIAAIYPAFVAARLAPLEAMRVE